MQHTLPTDEYILQLILKRNKLGIALLYDKYSAALYGLIGRFISQSKLAQDILLDVFEEVWNNADKYDASKGRLYYWLTYIARNTLVDKLLILARDITSPPFEFVKEHNAPKVNFQGLYRSDLKNILAQIATEHRLIIEYTYFRGYAPSKIADELGIPVGTIKKSLRAGVLHLRKIFQNEAIIMAA